MAVMEGGEVERTRQHKSEQNNPSVGSFHTHSSRSAALPREATHTHTSKTARPLTAQRRRPRKTPRLTHESASAAVWAIVAQLAL